jgi:hypothetical protein
MAESRRFTRSRFNSGREEDKNSNKEEAQLRVKVDEAIANQHLDKALALLKSASPRSHWPACARARVLFQQGSTPRALNAVRNFIKNEQVGCQVCF